MRLETVEKLTNDRDLAQRHIAFLETEIERLKAKNELTADELLRLKEENCACPIVRLFLTTQNANCRKLYPNYRGE